MKKEDILKYGHIITEAELEDKFIVVTYNDNFFNIFENNICEKPFDEWILMHTEDFGYETMEHLTKNQKAVLAEDLLDSWLEDQE